MKTILLSALLCLPAAAYSQDLKAGPEDAPAARGEAGEDVTVAQRPDSQKLISELSSALRLSSKQEDRISTAVRKKTQEFDKRMKEYEKNQAMEKEWRYKMNESRHELQKISRDIPDLVREYLDDEQRETYDELLQAKKKPAAEASAAEPGETAAPAAAKKKKVLVKRKKARAPEAAAEQGGEEAGQTMVDKGEGKPGLKKKKVLKRKPAAKAPAAEEPAAEEAPAAEEPAAGKETPPAEEDAGSYP